MIARLRGLAGRVFDPLAGLLVRLGVSADAVTIAATLGVVVVALWLLPTGHLLAGAIALTVLALGDALDGAVARKAGSSGPWGAFLDSTLDRLADGAIFTGLAGYFWIQVGGLEGAYGVVAALASLVLGFLVSYARARAGSLGFDANVGIAERGERLVVAIVGCYLVGFGMAPVGLAVLLGLLAFASAVTVVQRMAVVRRQVRATRTDTDPATGAGGAA
ncbi:CDP-alcohol phosphatidyltransferase family protein [Actinotalea sp. M2MS4P-6]|uniref:phosphatidylinositol phosphate synthase n=1 Tax=Actinotalea sp. M2MS4P-6 TaxID=2983762 RepID=UPI0021E4EFA6|nr:CDP-alcohol phosphatidyltransferase family protein [Actinotalea sp. M2MS4P-6]MCV2394521.1 CDP-alcohol phosphatidyltransferase family protein [Actinotalea sp. M2MS4P-6]